MYYFKFLIAKNTDGSRVSYSPGWHGTLTRCPKNVTVLLYNDISGYGIAKTEDTFVPKEVMVISKKEALEEVETIPEADGIWKGQKLADRWLPEAKKVGLNGQ